MARRWIGIGAIVSIVVLIAACDPQFPEGATVQAEPLGPLVTLTWTDAIPIGQNDPVDHYGIEVDGTEVAVTTSTAATCVLTGLAPDTDYTLSVTAYSASGGWSGTYGQQDPEKENLSRVSTDYHTPAGGNAGSSMDCVPATDSDGDRLPDAVETNDGNFVSAAQTGTDPANADTDGDGIDDGDEVLGTEANLDLPAIGTSAVHKDILLEVDWMDDSSECAAHSHRPTAAIETRAKDAFANAPITNPDGITGVNLIMDYGQGGALSGGNLVPDADGNIAGGVNGSEFAAIKAANFASNRDGYFHYVLDAHRYNSTSSSSGQAEINGDDLVVTLYCYYGDTDAVANTIMHELGHNLGLRHGGDEDTNYKWNYDSVMNYAYQFPGIDTDCDASGDGVLTYSTGSRPQLDEFNLVEA
ncbi:MAG: hypothetical protein KDB69_07605, partial [Acidimicrobiia bacterium]|nr:hypothetical protein [Acidimicrobiia bacterium]